MSVHAHIESFMLACSFSSILFFSVFTLFEGVNWVFRSMFLLYFPLFVHYSFCFTTPFDPFTPKSDQFRISHSLTINITSHSVNLALAYSVERWLYLPILTTSLTRFSSKGWANSLFPELESERVKFCRSVYENVSWGSSGLFRWCDWERPWERGWSVVGRQETVTLSTWFFNEEECRFSQWFSQHKAKTRDSDTDKQIWATDTDKVRIDCKFYLPARAAFL